MTRKTVFVISFIFVLVLAIPAIMAGDVYVDDDADPGWYDATHCHTIDDAITNMSNGDTVHIWSGSYSAPSATFKSGTYVGNGTDSIINTVVTDIANDTTFQSLNFSLDAMWSVNLNWDNTLTFTNCIFNEGLYFANGHTIKIENCDLYADHSSNVHGNIVTFQVHDLFVYNNTIESINSVWRGIYYTEGGDDITVRNNTIDNPWANVCVYGTNADRAENVLIENNTMLGSGKAMLLSKLEEPIVRNNNATVTGVNSEIFYMYDTVRNLTCYNNYFNYSAGDFLDNDWCESGTFNTTKTLGTNIINGPYLGGNYYWNYTGEDTDGDGIGNTPFPLGGGYTDYLPLTNSESPDVYVSNTMGAGWYNARHVATLLEGITNASTGDTVHVWEGTYTDYTGYVGSNKILTINGNGTDKTILRHVGGSYTWRIYTNLAKSTISNLTITSGGANVVGVRCGARFLNFTDCNISDNDAEGAYVENSNINFIDCLIDGNGDEGIRFRYGTNNCIVDGCTISNNTNGITTEATRNNRYTNSTFRDNTETGVTIASGTWVSVWNNITNNYFINNDIGLNLSKDSARVIRNCQIYNNYFDNTNINAYDNSTAENNWETPKTLGTNIMGGPYLGGNYWSDYTGTDTTGDGIGDTDIPYNDNIDVGGDFLPLVRYDAEPTLPYPVLNVEETTAYLRGSYENVTYPINPDHSGFWVGQITPVNESNCDFNFTGAYAYIDGAHAFAVSATGLSPGTYYYVKTYIHDATGWKNSSAEATFLTKPNSPTITVKQTNSSNVSVKITLSTTTVTNNSCVIVYKTSGYPSSPTDGTIGYNGSDTRVTITGLKTDTIYYLSAFSYINGSGSPFYWWFSDTYDTDKTATVGGIFNITFLWECNHTLIPPGDLALSTLWAETYYGNELYFNNSLTQNPMTIEANLTKDIIFMDWNTSGQIRSLIPSSMSDPYNLTFFICCYPPYDTGMNISNSQLFYTFSFEDRSLNGVFDSSNRSEFWLYRYNDSGKFYVHMDHWSAGNDVGVWLHYGNRYYVGVSCPDMTIPFLDYVDTSTNTEQTIIVNPEWIRPWTISDFINVNTSYHNGLWINYSDDAFQTIRVNCKIYWINGSSEELVNETNWTTSMKDYCWVNANESTPYTVVLTINHTLACGTLRFPFLFGFGDQIIDLINTNWAVNQWEQVFTIPIPNINPIQLFVFVLVFGVLVSVGINYASVGCLISGVMLTVLNGVIFNCGDGITYSSIVIGIFLLILGVLFARGEIIERGYR